jgi:hypothetical protein
MQAIKPLIISLNILGASREIQCFLQIRTVGDGQVTVATLITVAPICREGESCRQHLLLDESFVATHQLGSTVT